MAIELGYFETLDQIALYHQSYEEARQAGDTVSIGYYRSLLLAHMEHFKENHEGNEPEWSDPYEVHIALPLGDPFEL